MDPSTPTAAAAQSLELGAEIGSGAIARVVRVRDRATGQIYAGKILHPRHRRDPTATARFHREAELARRLRHPNLVTVHGTGVIEGETALLMELVEGHTLATHLARRGTLPPDELASLSLGIASGLAYAHATGVVHRDLKPANVLLACSDGAGPTPPVPKIADFGMARAASFAHADRRAMTVLGTPAYMAPECLEPLAVDPRTDLYALGCMMFEMATGQPPYAGSTPFSVLQAHRDAPIPELPEAYAGPLASLVARLLAKAPGDRPQSATVVVDELTAITSGERTPSGGSLPQLRSRTEPSTDEGRCAGCEATVLPELRLCFACGLIQARLEHGPNTVFICGPGKPTHKLDTARRDALVQWMRHNEAAGLSPRELEHRIPRLPFPFVSEVSDASAATIVESLRRLDLDATWLRGGRHAHPGIQKLAMALTGRKLTVLGAIFGVPFMVHPMLGLLTLIPALLIGTPIFYVLSTREAGRPALPRAVPPPEPLPPTLRGYLDRLHDVVPHIEQRRYRDALRAVVNRAVGLTRATPAQLRPSIDAEMSHAVNLAAVASQRMDTLDREMSRPDFDPSDPHHRSLLHERDMWSARLLDLTATLDALAARQSAAQARLQAAETEEIVASLRVMVESLEEVQRR